MINVIETNAGGTLVIVALGVFHVTMDTAVTQCATSTVNRHVIGLPEPATHAWMVITGQTVQKRVAADVKLTSVDRTAGNAGTAVRRGGRGPSARRARSVSMASTAPVPVTKTVWMNSYVMP